MKVLLGLMTVCLSISIGLNLYFYNRLTAETDEQANTPVISDVESVARQAQESPTSEEDTAPSPPSVPQTPLPDDVEDEQRAHWLEQSHQLLAAGNFGPLTVFLQNYLRQFPRDIEFLLIEADLIASTSHAGDALTHYYKTLDLPLSSEQRETLLEKIDELASHNIRQLRKIRSWDILATFLEPLWQFAPNKRSYILNLAEAYARQQLAAPMENVLASVMPDDPDANRIRALIRHMQRQQDKPDRSAPDPMSFERAIPLRRLGDHFIVRSQINRKHMDLMIDTGASTTVLTQTAFNQLYRRYKRQFIGEYMINTAGGAVKAPVYQLGQISIAGYQVSDIAVVVLPMENFHEADGLLGMNFLREFEFHIDQEEDLLFLK